MAKRFALDLVNNATDSLEQGLDHYDGEHSSPSDLKAALMFVFHGLELLLKERLARINPALILANIDAPFTEDSPTIRFSNIPERLSNFGVVFEKEDRAILRRVSKLRNRVQHSHFDMDHTEVSNDLGETLKVVFKFMSSELGLLPEDELTPTLFHKARELVHTYEELLEQAEKSLAAVMPVDPSERSQYIVLLCPECSHEYVDEEGKCHYCLEEFEIRGCEVCGERAPNGFCSVHGEG